jgi:hypothetical protein
MEHLLKLKCAHSPLNLHILSSTSVPFTLMTMQVPNLALTNAKRITVQIYSKVHKAYMHGTLRMYCKHTFYKLN